MATPVKPPRIDLAALKSSALRSNTTSAASSQQSSQDSISGVPPPHSALSYRSSSSGAGGDRHHSRSPGSANAAGAATASGLSGSTTTSQLPPQHNHPVTAQHTCHAQSSTTTNSQQPQRPPPPAHLNSQDSLGGGQESANKDHTRRWSPSRMPMSSEEASHVLQVMIRAKEFDAAEAKAQQGLGSTQQAPPAHPILEGQLSKYTNVMKGWQYRWFILDPNQGTLEYYMPDDKRRKQPRGRIDLAGAIICPSEEDGTLLSVSATTGECYKLKTVDGKERQFWVDKLRQAAQLAADFPASSRRSSSKKGSAAARKAAYHARRVSPDPTTGESATLAAVRDILVQTQTFERSVAGAIEAHTCTEPDLLMLKATSAATAASLEDCFGILQAIEQSVRR